MSGLEVGITSICDSLEHCLFAELLLNFCVGPVDTVQWESTGTFFFVFGG